MAVRIDTGVTRDCADRLASAVVAPLYRSAGGPQNHDRGACPSGGRRRVDVAPADSVPIAQPLSATFMNAYSHLMEFAAYDAHRMSRPSRGGSGFFELAAAPFNRRSSSPTTCGFLPSSRRPRLLGSTWPSRVDWEGRSMKPASPTSAPPR